MSYQGTALWYEGAQHVAREVGGSQGEERAGVANRLLEGLKKAERPPAYAQGVTDACKAALSDLYPRHDRPKRRQDGKK